MQKIKWSPKEINLVDTSPTPNNYKIKTDLGKERLSMSMALFGNASTVIVNAKEKGKYPIIDGNSRCEEEKELGTKKIWVMVPNRKLSPKEYKEMSAMFDYAKAGEVDIDRIRQDLGTSKQWYEKWKDEMPLHMLDKVKGLGKNASPLPKASMEYPDVPDAVSTGEMTVMVNLFFTAKQEEQFRKMEEKLAKKWKKTESTTDRVFEAFKQLTK